MDFCEDRADLDPLRARAWEIIRATPHLDYLILTKRPERFPDVLPAGWRQGGGRANVWLGTTVGVRRHMARRVGALMGVPARVRFLSCEPLLEDVADDLLDALAPACGFPPGGSPGHLCAMCLHYRPPVRWVIIGGESSQGGRDARPFDVAWASRIIDVCRRVGAAPFMKQAGDRPVALGYPDGYSAQDVRPLLPLRMAAHHGGDPAEWPEGLRAREFPTPA